MRLTYFLFLLICSLSFCQNSVFIKTGRNITEYTYTNELGDKASNISSDFGNSYSFGYSKNLKYKLNKHSFVYDSEISFDEFNSSVYSKNLLVHWRTIYGSINNALLIPILNPKKFNLYFKLGGNVSTIIYGKQELDNLIYDLKNTNSFKGIFLTGVIGIQAKYLVSEFGGFSVGYDELLGFNPSLNNPERFSISSSRIWLGVNFNLKK